MPALQSPWFAPHVIVYMFAYAMLGAAVVMAVYLLWIKKKTPEEREMELCDNLVNVGLAFMTLGMFLLAGLEKCAIEGKDRESKAANYALVQELAEEFKKRNGALRCADLLGLSGKEPVVSTPEARTERYYAKRPCARMVEEAARIWSEHLEKQKK